MPSVLLKPLWPVCGKDVRSDGVHRTDRVTLESFVFGMNATMIGVITIHLMGA